MASVGRHRQVVEQVNELAPVTEKFVKYGLEMLLNNHKLTNQIAMHGHGPLADQLADQDVLRTYVLALFVELGELVQELDWKPWRGREKPVDIVKVVDEFADILAFLGVILTLLEARGVTPDMIAAGYNRKVQVNIRRFLEAQK